MSKFRKLLSDLVYRQRLEARIAHQMKKFHQEISSAPSNTEKEEKDIEANASNEKIKPSKP